MARQQRRLPRPIPPIMIELAYFSALKPIVDQMTSLVTRGLIPHLEDILNDVHYDAAPEGADRAKRRAEKLIDGLAEKMVNSIRPTALSDAAAKYAARTSDFQKDQLAAQVRAAVSIDIKKIAITERGIKGEIDGWIASNVALIRTMPSTYFDDVKSQVFDAISVGTRHETLASQMVERYGIPENRAALIARDQVGKLYGNLNAARQQNLGVTGYIWRTVRDNRVREDHEDRDGDPFTWDSPPDDGHPGEPINCRCYAEPDLSDLSALVDSD